MPKIINLRFLSMEFDFGYNEENEETHDRKGRVDSEVFVEIDNDGEVSVVTHRVDLNNLDILDFISEEDKADIIGNINTVGEYIQSLRRLVSLKVAMDLNMEIAEFDYISTPSLRTEVGELREVLDILIGGEDNE